MSTSGTYANHLRKLHSYPQARAAKYFVSESLAADYLGVTTGHLLYLRWIDLLPVCQEHELYESCEGLPPTFVLYRLSDLNDLLASSGDR